MVLIKVGREKVLNDIYSIEKGLHLTKHFNVIKMTIVHTTQAHKSYHRKEAATLEVK